tara:strand:- start:53695 stop:55425 length:1731 start_codon:yes stop_codon:yes gene_type:complete
MADFVGYQHTPLARVDHFIGDDTGVSTKAYQRSAPAIRGLVTHVDLTDFVTTLVAGPGKTDFTNNAEFTYALFYDAHQPDWYENYHVVPRSFDFGNILSTQTSPLEVFSGFRRTFGVWSSFVNNAGAGTTLLGQPALPAAMNPLAGYAMTLEVSTNGNPSVDDDLAFVFDFGVETINVPIVLNRIVLFPVRPEIPYVEKLQFLTDVIKHADGSEQRVSLRKNPRQLFEWDVRLDDGEFEKSRLDTLLFDWQSRTWGVPMWHEATQVSVAITLGDLTINVASTADADYRVDGLVMMYTDSTTFDVQTIDSFTATTITLKNATLNSFPVGATVAPLRTGNMKKNVSGSRFRSADQSTRVQFRIIDNDSNLADTTGWSTHNSKVMLDTCNVMVGATISDQYVRELILVDNKTGVTYQDGVWEKNKHGFSLTLSVKTKADLWDVRQLMHALRGRQVSFYVPTYNQDLLPTEDLQSASQDLVMQNIGYTQFVRGRQPKNRIWVRTTAGVIYDREITSFVETSDTIETLTMGSTWGADITLAEIDRISYLEEVRYNSDEITIRHERGERLVRISAPVITVFD